MSSNVISGLPADLSQLTIQKSNPLLCLWSSTWSLTEFKLLDIYLSRIDSHHPEKRCVRLEKGELEKILGVSRIRLKDLQNRLDRLIIPVHIVDCDAPEGHLTIALFDSIKYVPDESGLWIIDIQCSQDAMKYIFNIENLGYLRYKLQAVINLQSKHSYLLFLYVEQNRFRIEWTVGLEELQQLLGCDTFSYPEYKRFNDKVLKPSQAEISKRTNCRFSYTPVRRGRRTNALKFSVEDLPVSVKENSIVEGDALQSEPEIRTIHGRSFLEEALTLTNSQKSEFSKAQLAEIFSYLITVPLSKMPQSPEAYGPEIQRYNYLACKFAELNRRDDLGGVRNRFAYLLTMIKKDAGYS